MQNLHVRVFLICMLFAVTLKGASARWRIRINCCRPLAIQLTVESNNWPSRKRSALDAEAEFVQWLQNNATVSEILQQLDINCDGCVDAKEWSEAGDPISLTNGLGAYDSNGDNCISMEEIAGAPFEMMEMKEFMLMPMEEFEDMMMMIEGGEDVDDRRRPNGRKPPADDE